MHSASMTLSQPELSDFTGAIVDLLEDPGVLGQSTSAQEALENIRDVSKIDTDHETQTIYQHCSIPPPVSSLRTCNYDDRTSPPDVTH